MPKPALGPVKVGDELIVIPAPNKWNPRPNVEAVVEKVGRVWVELRDANDVRSLAKRWRMRLDTQNEGHSTHLQDRFVTAEQLAYEQRRNEAQQVLQDAGLSIRSESPWRTDEDRLLALAAFVAAYDADHPTDPAA